MVKKKAKIVVGLGYGDEGKGLTTDFLCKTNENPIVIRFNGGHQAGHCVVTKEGKKHIFSNLGSGTLRNVPTFWSSFCTFCPPFFIEELSLLDFHTIFYIDYNSPITTHYDILFNRTNELSLGKERKGSCGVGFGATIERERNSKISFVLNDLLDEHTVSEKLRVLNKYYKPLINIATKYNFNSFNHTEEDKIFCESVKKFKELIRSGIVVPTSESELFENKNFQSYIFEGAQGILLDENFGQFPHITKSNTTSKNAIEIINRHRLDVDISVVYVTRAYQTRHGAGPFPKQHSTFLLVNNKEETNVTNNYQGVFKTNYLNINKLNDSIEYDSLFSSKYSKELIITCLDHFKGSEIRLIKNSRLINLHYTKISEELNSDFSNVYYSFKNCADYVLDK